MPPWLSIATRRRRLLSMGISITEQRSASARELDELIAVDDEVNRWQEDQADKQRRESS